MVKLAFLNPKKFLDMTHNCFIFLPHIRYFLSRHGWWDYFSEKSLINEMRKTFSYRLSRVRRIIENTFGILVTRWRIFQKPFELRPENVEELVLVVITLHSYSGRTDNGSDNPSGFIDSKIGDSEIIPGQWRNHLDDNTFHDVPKYSMLKVYR